MSLCPNTFQKKEPAEKIEVNLTLFTPTFLIKNMLKRIYTVVVHVLRNHRVLMILLIKIVNYVL